uniref:Uncharacterized protein n=1 Tax=Glossina pallidipes TaxID=7398 RepID=A0A1A9ZBD6_GLOPL
MYCNKIESKRGGRPGGGPGIRMPIRGRLLKAGGRGPGGGPDGIRMPKPCIPGGRGSGGLKSIGGAKPAKEGTGGPGIDKCACVLAVFGAKATGSATTVVVVAFPVVLVDDCALFSLAILESTSLFLTLSSHGLFFEMSSPSVL